MIRPYYDKDDITIYHGDLLDVLPQLPETSVDCVVTDPPYGIGFMEKEWDHGVPGPDVLAGHRPSVQAWCFALSLRRHANLSPAHLRDRRRRLGRFGIASCGCMDKASRNRWTSRKLLDKAAGAVREVIGASRSIDCLEPRIYKVYSTKAENSGFGTSTHLWAWAYQLPLPLTPEAAKWNGWGTALKPAWEPIVLAMKPLDGTFARNAETWGVAGMNIDGCRIGDQSKGRWPANLAAGRTGRTAA